MLRQQGAGVKTAQEMLRHANPRITVAIYQQAVSEEKRAAQDRICDVLFDRSFSIGTLQDLGGGLERKDLCHKPTNSVVYGGDDGARTRDLCRDSKEGFRNLLKSGAPDGHFWSPETPLAPVIAPLSHPRPLSTKPLPKRRFS
jgi:hypothetical protein